jgi:threonine dehydrogenase-like Zn-dependent dehydrogenase
MNSCNVKESKDMKILEHVYVREYFPCFPSASITANMSSSIPSTHSALVQTTYAQPLELQTIPTPPVTPGCAVIKVLYAPILSYFKDVFNGTRAYPYPTPLVPGPCAIGRIVDLSADSTALQMDQTVYIDSLVRSRDNPSDMFLLGLMQGGTAGSAKLMKDVWRNGTYAEYCSVPLENVYAFDEVRLVKEMGYKLQELAILDRYLVPYGGLRDIALSVGETVVVTPATGPFGSGAIAVSLAMGAAKIVAMGRNRDTLRNLAAHFGSRVATVVTSNDVDTDTAALTSAADGPIDAVFEISPPAAANSSHIVSAIRSLRRGGRVSLMGGIQEDYAIPLRTIMFNGITLRGKFMYERGDVNSLIRMIETGQLEIGERNGVGIAGRIFALEDWEEAFDSAQREASAWDKGVVFGIGQ